MASIPTSINDLPDEILQDILSYFKPEDLCLKIAKVCKKWKLLATDVILWKKLSYRCGYSSDISSIKEVSCTALLGFTTNWLKNFAPCTVLKVQNLKEHFRSLKSFHPD